jgi:hypothetical protein
VDSASSNSARQMAHSKLSPPPPPSTPRTLAAAGIRQGQSLRVERAGDLVGGGRGEAVVATNVVDLAGGGAAPDGGFVFLRE